MSSLFQLWTKAVLGKVSSRFINMLYPPEGAPLSATTRHDEKLLTNEERHRVANSVSEVEPWFRSSAEPGSDNKWTLPLLKNLFWSRFPTMMRAPLPSSGPADFPFTLAALRDFVHSSSTRSNAGRIASLTNVNANTLCTPLWSSITQSFPVAATHLSTVEKKIGKMHPYAESG